MDAALGCRYRFKNQPVRFDTALFAAHLAQWLAKVLCYAVGYIPGIADVHQHAGLGAPPGRGQRVGEKVADHGSMLGLSGLR